MAFTFGAILVLLMYFGSYIYFYVVFKRYVDRIREIEIGTRESPRTADDMLSYESFARKVFFHRLRRSEHDPDLETMRRKASRRFLWVIVVFLTSPIIPIALSLKFDIK